MIMTCMGWSTDQWAEAVAWFARVKGWTPLPKLSFCAVVRVAWFERHRDAPSAQRLIVVEEWARRRRADRDYLLCDDPKELARMRRERDELPPLIEMNMDWAHRLMVDAAMKSMVVL